MTKIKIIVVEDEVIVAKDIQKTLIKLGYDVPAIANSAQSAFEKIDEYDPDLIFCDIKLKGEKDGIDIAQKLHEEYLIPVIFLTSYADKATLSRAKVAEPYGYIVKPFNEIDLQTTVEIALYKFTKDQEVRDNEQRFANVLQKIEEAIFIVDLKNKISYINPRAEELFTLNLNEVIGKGFDDLILINNQEYLTSANNDETELITINNASIKIKNSGLTFNASFSISNINDEINESIGKAILIKEIKTHSNNNETTFVNTPIESIVFHDSFFVKKGSLLVKVYLENIYFIQALDNYVIIQTNKDQFVVHSTMRDIEAKLPPDKFARVHRSYIVQIDKIGLLEENTVLINEKVIPVGKSYRDAFLKRLNFL